MYSIEADFPDPAGGYDQYPISEEPDDIGAFKVGSQGAAETIDYVSLIVGPSGRLLDMNGWAVGFNTENNFGADPAAPENDNFFIEDDLLWYVNGTDWVLCPFHRDQETLYTIQYDTNCPGGYKTEIRVIARVPYHSTVLPEANYTALQSSYTYFTDNSLQSYTVAAPHPARPAVSLASVLWRLALVLLV